jgi:hypothetical protein
MRYLAWVLSATLFRKSLLKNVAGNVGVYPGEQLESKQTYL